MRSLPIPDGFGQTRCGGDLDRGRSGLNRGQFGRGSFEGAMNAVTHYGYRRRGSEPATTSAMVAAALSHALAIDAARART